MYLYLEAINVRYTILSILDPRDFFATNASSAIIITAESSFLGIVAFIILDLDDSRLQVQEPSFNLTSIDYSTTSGCSGIAETD